MDTFGFTARDAVWSLLLSAAIALLPATAFGDSDGDLIAAVREQTTQLIEDAIKPQSDKNESQEPSAGKPSTPQVSTAPPRPDTRPVLYVFRASELKSALASANVLFDSDPLSLLFSGTYLKVRVPSGKHVIAALGPKKPETLELDMADGGAYYVQVSVGWKGQPSVVSLAKEEAEPILATCKAASLFEFGRRTTPANVTEERETLKAGADQSTLPASPMATDAAVPAASPLAISVPAAPPPLTDEQIEAAIKRGMEDQAGKKWWGVRYLDILPRDITINKSLFSSSVSQRILVLSDSDRIAVAADIASHEVTKQRRRPKTGFSYSVKDAKASTVVMGVTTVIVEFGGRGSNVAEWYGPTYSIVLNADGKIVEPFTTAQYLARAPATGSARMKPWDYHDFFDYNVCGSGPVCSFTQRVFPVIQGAQKLTVITTSANGHRIEKEVDPKLFEER